MFETHATDDLVPYLDVRDLVPGIKFDRVAYARSEQEIITPALVDLGYEVGAWYTSQRTYGSLTRCARISKDGKVVVVAYTSRPRFSF